MSGEEEEEGRKEDALTSKNLTTLTWQVGKKTIFVATTSPIEGWLVESCELHCVCILNHTHTISHILHISGQFSEKFIEIPSLLVVISGETTLGSQGFNYRHKLNLNHQNLTQLSDINRHLCKLDLCELDLL